MCTSYRMTVWVFLLISAAFVFGCFKATVAFWEQLLCLFLLLRSVFVSTAHAVLHDVKLLPVLGGSWWRPAAGLTEKQPMCRKKRFSSCWWRRGTKQGKTLKVKRSFIHPCSDLSATLPCIHWLSVWVCQEPSVSVHLHPPPQIPADPLADRIRGSGGKVSLWGPLSSLPPPCSPWYSRCTELIQVPQRGCASWLYIYTVCSKSINAALRPDMWPMGAAERLIAAGTEGGLVASLQELVMLLLPTHLMALRFMFTDQLHQLFKTLNLCQFITLKMLSIVKFRNCCTNRVKGYKRARIFQWRKQ